MIRPWRAKLAALVLLFFLGTFAGQIQHLLDSLRGRVDRGARVVEDFRATVTTIAQAVDGTTAQLRAQIADLQAKLASGTATPAQVSQLQGLVERLRAAGGQTGAPGPPGPTGAPGPPGPPSTTAPGSSPSTTTATTATTTTTTTRPAPTTSTTGRRPSTTTTTRCTVGLGQLLKVGCS